MWRKNSTRFGCLRGVCRASLSLHFWQTEMDGLPYLVTHELCITPTNAENAMFEHIYLGKIRNLL
jgi:hypothetical protein